VPSGEIEMPAPYGVAPAPGLRWEPGIDFAAMNIRALITLWHARCPSRHGLPSYSQFDALELRPWADHLIVLDLDITLFGKRCFRYRSVGPAASAVEGGNFSGLYLGDALSPAQADPRIVFYERAMRARAPVELHRPVEVVGQDGAGSPGAQRDARWDSVALPLSEDHHHADHLMVLTYVEVLGQR
jgi:hypothetical protein